jgi:hypothetical protein
MGGKEDQDMKAWERDGKKEARNEQGTESTTSG